jgi:sensor histidine kinase YesM
MKVSNSEAKILLLHLLLWVFYLTYRLSDFPSRLGLENGLIYVGVPLVFYLAISYVHYFYLLPLWLKRAPAYFAWLLLFLTVTLVIQVIVENIFFRRFLPGATEITFARILRTLWNPTMFILFTSLIKITVDRFQFEARKRQLENEKLVAELNYLKAQINPHFLFNTLHNLHFLVHSHAENAAEIIIKLSNLMRYMIYDANHETVLLQTEIDYMKDYIDLETIRLNSVVKIDFRIEGNTEVTRIAPLILFPLLENAFKHGVNDEHADSWIEVDLKVNGEHLSFHVRNSIADVSPVGNVSGFGLRNLERRLQLTYANEHTLGTSETDNVFDARLVLTKLR